MGGVKTYKKPFKRAIVGGAFDRLHKGHRRLLEVASYLADDILIGLADGPLLTGKPLNELIMPYNERKKRLESFLNERGVNFHIVRIVDPIGPASEDEEADIIVVTPETYERALLINEEREKRGLKELIIVVVPLVKAEDGKPLKSSRIRYGEIDEEGRLLRPKSRKHF